MIDIVSNYTVAMEDLNLISVPQWGNVAASTKRIWKTPPMKSLGFWLFRG